MNDDVADGILLKSRNDQGFTILFNRYWERLYKKAFLRLGNINDAQDIVQEVFLSLWRNREQIQVVNSLEPYLFMSVKYSIIKHVYKAAKKGIEVPLSVAELDQSELSVEELLQYKDLQSAIAWEVAQLPERMKEIFQLSRTDNLSIQEIALKLGLTEQTVKNTLTTTLKRLRTKLSRYNVWVSIVL